MVSYLVFFSLANFVKIKTKYLNLIKIAARSERDLSFPLYVRLVVLSLVNGKLVNKVHFLGAFFPTQQLFFYFNLASLKIGFEEKGKK